MLHFDSDYMEGAHPEILRRLAEINFEKNAGYGQDEHCRSAARKIRSACFCPDAAVYFLPGGTQSNATVIDSLLKGYQGVVTAKTGHINVHEAGAIEAYGHKILALEQSEGKLEAKAITAFLDAFHADPTKEHMVEPGMVCISHPTEYGTLYTAAELEAISAACRRGRIPLYLDGARLGYGLSAQGTDVTLRMLAQLCDVFYIGGTKVGALLGEAVVFPNPALADHFFTYSKRHGGVMAKGWIQGVQFDVLFTDGLYFDIAGRANALALELKQGLVQKGYRMFTDSVTNQQLVIVSDEKLLELDQKLTYSYWERFDEEHSVIRLATSWATTQEQITALLELF